MIRIAALIFVLFAATASAVRAAPSLAPAVSAADWLNGRPTAGDLRGRVVIVDVFTFDCVNCKHVVPALRSLYGSTSRRDLAIVGIHSPETDYEKDRGNVVRNLAAQRITWPVAIDNTFALWRAYGIEYWPTQLIFDRRGILRKTVVGEGQDDVVRATVKALIAEAPLRATISPNGRTYTIGLNGTAGSAVKLLAMDIPTHWVAAFCTAKLCAPFRVTLTLPQSGKTSLEFRVVPPGGTKAREVPFRVQLASGSQSVTLKGRYSGR